MTRSAKKNRRVLHRQCNLYSLYLWPRVFVTVLNVKKIIKIDRLVCYDFQAESSGWLFKSPLAGGEGHIVGDRATDRTACYACVVCSVRLHVQKQPRSQRHLHITQLSRPLPSRHRVPLSLLRRQRREDPHRVPVLRRWRNGTVRSRAFNAVVTTTIRLRFDGRSTTVRLFIKGHLKVIVALPGGHSHDDLFIYLRSSASDHNR